MDMQIAFNFSLLQICCNKYSCTSLHMPKKAYERCQKVNLLGHKFMYIFNFKSTPTSSSNRPQAASTPTSRCWSIFSPSPMGWLWK